MHTDDGFQELSDVPAISGKKFVLLRLPKEVRDQLLSLHRTQPYSAFAFIGGSLLYESASHLYPSTSCFLSCTAGGSAERWLGEQNKQESCCDIV